MENEIKCIKCGSTQITAQKKGFSATKAVGGAILTGGIGILAGMHGSNAIEVTCINCGTSWNPKKLAEQKQKEAVADRYNDLRRWKNEFKSAYKKGDFEKAEQIYLTKQSFFKGRKDVHEVYRFHKEQDRQIKIAGLVLFLVIILLFFWMAK